MFVAKIHYTSRAARVERLKYDYQGYEVYALVVTRRTRQSARENILARSALGASKLNLPEDNSARDWRLDYEILDNADACLDTLK
jgi:hypothetical protein